MSQSSTGKSNAWSEFWDWVKSISIALVIVVVLNLYVFNFSTVKGHSMEPTLKDKEWLFINKIVYAMDSPKRGDVIVLKELANASVEDKFLIKRVVGLPGDRVEIRNGELYVNGSLVNEPYTDHRVEDGDRGPFVVEDSRYYVLGDNRHVGASLDSRVFGTIRKDQIQGRADLILWPISKIGSL